MSPDACADEFRLTFKDESGVEIRDGSFFIDDIPSYLDAIGELYAATANEMNGLLREKLAAYIAANGNKFPTSDSAGGFPGTHAEIQAVNDLLNRGVDVSDISVGTIRIEPPGNDFPACTNCAGILEQLGITDVPNG